MYLLRLVIKSVCISSEIVEACQILVNALAYSFQLMTTAPTMPTALFLPLAFCLVLSFRLRLRCVKWCRTATAMQATM
jgi:hypothetical protein